MSDVCECAGPSTRGYVRENGNVCAECGKKILLDRAEGSSMRPSDTEPSRGANVKRDERSSGVEENAYDVPQRTSVQRGENTADDSVGNGPVNNLPQHPSALDYLSDAVLGNTRLRYKRSGFKMQLPRFSGVEGEDPRHYFLKMTAFLEAYDIDQNAERVRVFLDSLQGPAMDLYVSLSWEEQSDIAFLHRVFLEHFKPRKHAILEASEILNAKKKPSESISNFLLRLKKWGVNPI